MLYWRSICFGILSFSLQLVVLFLLCPEENLVKAWFSMASHWDSEWYEAIAMYGYLNLGGPTQTGLTTANVVFFPGYPYFARLLIFCFHCQPKVALLVVSQGASLGFWCLFFIILKENRWWLQWCVALLVATFPTSWFFFMGYSESLFMFFSCLMLWFSTRKKWILAGIFGILMTMTRIIGLPILLAPSFAMLVTTVAKRNFGGIETRLGRRIVMKACFSPLKVFFVGASGCLFFFLYCAVKFGSWHLYFDMEKIGWHGTANPWFFLKLSTWLPPPWGYSLDFAPSLPAPYGHWFGSRFYQIAAYTFSETLVPLFLWGCGLFTYGIFRKNQVRDMASLTWYFAAILTFVFNCVALETRYYESMSRCLYAVWIFLLLSDVLHPQKLLIFRLRPVFVVSICFGICLIFSRFWVQFLLRYYLGWWVA